MGNSDSKENEVAVREENLLEKFSKMNERQAQLHQNGMREMREMFVAQQDTNLKLLGAIMAEAQRKEERKLEEARKAGERNKYVAIGLVIVAYFISQNSLESVVSLNALLAITCTLGALIIFIQHSM